MPHFGTAARDALQAVKAAASVRRSDGVNERVISTAQRGSLLRYDPQRPRSNAKG